MNNAKDDVKSLANRIASLANDLVKNLDSKGDFYAPANELVKNTSTLVFALGEVYASDMHAITPKPATKVNSGSYHNVRDSKGRFASKV